MKKESDQIEIENILHHLNYRWNIETLAQWEGARVPFKPYQIYDGNEIFISHDTLERIDKLKNKSAGTRLKYALIDHFLQRSLLPHETEMRGWMQGAAAIVNGKKIYFHDIIPWCQKSSTYKSRQILQKETGDILKKWWSQGNRHDIFQFFEINGLGQLTTDLLLKRWKENLS